MTEESRDSSDAPASRSKGGPRLAAALSALIFLALGSWALFSSTSAPGSGREAAASAPTSSAPAAENELAFPEGREVMALIALDRDVADYRAHSAIKGPAGAYYRKQVELCLSMWPLRGKYEEIFAAAQAERSGKGADSSAIGGRKLASYLAKAPSPFSKADFWFTPKEQLKHAHPFALDVFFKSFKREDGKHFGPKIRALYPGIVVAAAGDWKGGAGAAAYEGGGLSPAAGNGVVVFDRASRRYYTYLHMSEVEVEAGDIVKAGAVLGRGGNTGMNARRLDHGGHVHLEIFDCERDTALRGTEILDIIKR